MGPCPRALGGSCSEAPCWAGQLAGCRPASYTSVRQLQKMSASTLGCDPASNSGLTELKYHLGLQGGEKKELMELQDMTRSLLGAGGVWDDCSQSPIPSINWTDSYSNLECTVTSPPEPWFSCL